MKAYRISVDIAERIKGKSYTKDSYFNPLLDIKGNWFISVEEYENNTNWRYKDDLKEAVLEKYIAPLPADFIESSK